MKEKWKEWSASLSDPQIMSKREFLLTIAVCVLGGIVFGMFCSPKKSTVIGSNNGNNSGNYAKDEKQEENCKKDEKNPQSPTAGIANEFIEQILESYLGKNVK